MSNKPQNIILEGVIGSTAYGLATENSDVDVKGIYMLPTEKVMGLRFSLDNTTVDNTDPDWCYHEVGKFMKLAAGGNPTITELLFLTDYTQLSPVGQLLIDNRNIFLSTQGVQKAYRGYAMGQAKKLNRRQAEGKQGYDSALKNRMPKHTRHCFRLLLQARELMETGTLTVKVTQEQREWLFKMGETNDPEKIVDMFIAEDKKLDNFPSVLPDKPDWEAIEALHLKIRTMGDGRVPVKPVLKLVKAHAEGNHEDGQAAALEIAQSFDKTKDWELSEYILAQYNLIPTWVAQ